MKIRYWIALTMLVAMMAAGCNNKSGKQQDTSQLDSASTGSSLDQQIKQNPDDASLYNKRANQLLAQGDINKALNDINKAIELEGRNDEFMLTLSDIYFAMGQLRKTEQTLQAILIEKPDNLDALLKISNLYLYQEDHNKAFGFLNRALQADPNDHRVYFLSGMINKDKGEISKAERDFHRSVEMKQDFYEAWIQLGVIASKQQDSLAALYFKNALNVRPESEEALYNLGYFYQQQGKVEKAVNTYNQLLDVNPQSERGYYNLGYIYLTIKEDFKKAEQFYRQALDVNPNNVNSVYNLGSALEQQGEIEEARKLFKQTLQMQENYPLGIEALNRLDSK